ncbi:MAG: hypothetical protein H6816_02525 [Phycisphaerales bacterium]|nr:hypothetical protein [Phycisphaerales bacterium]
MLTMLQNTTSENHRLITFQLEGRLDGPQLHELEQCRRYPFTSTSRPGAR